MDKESFNEIIKVFKVINRQLSTDHTAKLDTEALQACRTTLLTLVGRHTVNNYITEPHLNLPCFQREDALVELYRNT